MPISRPCTTTHGSVRAGSSPCRRGGSRFRARPIGGRLVNAPRRATGWSWGATPAPRPGPRSAGRRGGGPSLAGSRRGSTGRRVRSARRWRRSSRPTGTVGDDDGDGAAERGGRRRRDHRHRRRSRPPSSPPAIGRERGRLDAVIARARAAAASLRRPSSSANLRSASQSCGLAGTGRLRSVSATAPAQPAVPSRQAGPDSAAPRRGARRAAGPRGVGGPPRCPSCPLWDPLEQPQLESTVRCRRLVRPAQAVQRRPSRRTRKHRVLGRGCWPTP